MDFTREMDRLMAELPAGTGLVLHSCCGPCSSSVLERLAAHFEVTVLYYDPNIWPREEYERRREEQRMLIDRLPTRWPVHFVEGPYVPADFYEAAKGLEEEPERGGRCAECFRLRLGYAARWAKENGFGWMTTTLTVSPHKNAPLLNEIGSEAAGAAGICFLPSDFKKREGYKRSLALSQQFGMYRQDYCGCEFSYYGRYPERKGKG